MADLLSRLEREGILSPGDALAARRRSASGVPLDEALLGLEGVETGRLVPALAAALGVPHADLETEVPTREFLAGFPARILVEHALVPLREEPDGGVRVATSRVFDASGLDELRIASGRECRPALAAPAEIERCLKSRLGVGAETVESLVSEAGAAVQVVTGEESVDLSEAAEDASIIRFVNEVLIEAIERRATDVHFEPFEDELRVRYRVDGVLQEAAIPGDVRRFRPAIISRLKILSRLDIAEKRVPQDGRISLAIGGREIDVRVSVIPMIHGEAIVLRLLDRSGALFGLEELGMGEPDTARFEQTLGLPHGIVLVTGPTGSGKTTTLYAALSRINSTERKIITIEDPVEYQLHGINQIQVSGKAGLSFARGLRSILRHDPDVILVGEIRDLETAEIAVQASLTGHLVFSTLHTNDAPGALTRLVDMGVEPYLVASSLEAVVAQRLVRLLCPVCRVEMTGPERAAAGRYGLDGGATLWAPGGCRACGGMGYRGRTGIFEFMPVTDEVRSLILGRASSGEVRRVAREAGMRSLREDGLRLVGEGRTTIEEVLRVTRDERMHTNGLAPAERAEEGGGG
jgi:general secretion pathway protein E/type IV pilus assembly protein PilB